MLPSIFKGFLIGAWNSLLDVLTTRSAREFERFTTAPIPGSPAREQAPAVVNVEPLKGQSTTSSPADCEEMFTTHIRSGHFDSAWDLLTPDSQASWQDRTAFKQEMQSREPARDRLGSTVREVRFLPTWTDQASRRTYHQVAELVVDYHIRNRSRSMVVTRDVHLVNVSGGWKSLCYKT
jgi:hypothetical protein